MGGATAIGLAKAGKVAASDITVTARHESTLARFKEYGIVTCTDNVKAAAGADAVILAVKPWIMESVCREIAPVIDKQLVISVAPGVKGEELVRWLTSPSAIQEAASEAVPSISYLIPNTAIELCESMNFIAPVTASEADLARIAELFEGTGRSMVVPASKMMAGTALASCGIAYALRYIRAASEGGVEMGFYAKEAEEIVAQTVRGAAAILQAHGSHPEEEIDKVTTPGGLTIKGLNAMEEAGFTNAVIQGLKAGRC